LRFGASQIDDQNVKYVANTLKYNKVRNISSPLLHIDLYDSQQTLTTLSLGSNYIQSDGAHHLADGFKNNTVRLFYLLSIPHFFLLFKTVTYDTVSLR
jgi:hypothetical protein